VLPTPGQTFRPDPPKNSAAGEKIRPLQNLLINANITVFYTLFHSAKETNNQRYQEMKCTFLQIFELFYMNNHLQKSSARFRPFLAFLKKIRPPIFPAAQIFLGPLLSSAAEISAP
jgi:hypothetical protein